MHTTATFIDDCTRRTYTRMGVLILSVAYKVIMSRQYREGLEIYDTFMGIFIVV